MSNEVYNPATNLSAAVNGNTNEGEIPRQSGRRLFLSMLAAAINDGKKRLPHSRSGVEGSCLGGFLRKVSRAGASEGGRQQDSNTAFLPPLLDVCVQGRVIANSADERGGYFILDDGSGVHMEVVANSAELSLIMSSAARGQDEGEGSSAPRQEIILLEEEEEEGDEQPGQRRKKFTMDDSGDCRQVRTIVPELSSWNPQSVADCDCIVEHEYCPAPANSSGGTAASYPTMTPHVGTYILVWGTLLTLEEAAGGGGGGGAETTPAVTSTKIVANLMKGLVEPESPGASLTDAQEIVITKLCNLWTRRVVADFTL